MNMKWKTYFFTWYFLFSVAMMEAVIRATA